MASSSSHNHPPTITLQMTSSKSPPSTCKVCGIAIAHKGDMPRHMRTHSDHKEAIQHRCPFEGCPYADLQQSNVNTHIRTHTGEKTRHCPDCISSFVDPAALTRHRRDEHNYLPEPRRRRAVTTTKKSKSNPSSSTAAPRKKPRRRPYPRSRPNTSPSPSASSSSDEQSASTSETLIPPTTTPEDSQPISSQFIPLPDNFFWPEYDERIAGPSEPTFKVTHPAVETNGQMQGYEEAHPQAVPQDYLAGQPFMAPVGTAAPLEWMAWNLGINGYEPHAPSEVNLMQPVAVNDNTPVLTEEAWNWFLAEVSMENWFFGDPSSYAGSLLVSPYLPYL